MDIILNGKKRFIGKNIFVKNFLEEIGEENSIDLSGAVVLINDNIIKKDNWENVLIKNGDIVEVLSFVSGG